jgi:uncharacterized protein
MRATRTQRVHLILCIGIVSLCTGCGKPSAQEQAHAAAVARDRAAKDAYFGGPDSPLTSAQRAAFRGLRYYPPALHWATTASFDAAARADTVYFPTSKGSFDTYLRAGTLHFTLAGRRLQLSLYRAADDGHWFLPFTDATSARTTYGAGRYLDLDVVPGLPVTLDFNRAYNPYCAYNAEWVCPLAPTENRLPLGIEAGEKSFTDGH